jgi:hypothetical protein
LPPSESEVLIQRRIEQTGRRVKGVDIADGLLTLAIGVLAYLLAVAAIDHWLVVGGLGFWERLGLWLVLVGAAATFFVIRLLPPLVHRINPLFSATTIEQSRPSLKNSLVNFLLFRRQRQGVATIVYQAMEHRAAADLDEVEMDVAVDRTHVIHLGYVLVVVLALFCLYLVVSPKNPIRSAARVLLPWSNIDAPTRVTIHDVQPGDTTAFLGEFVTVSAELSGLRDDEPALVIYSTADGQTVDQEVPMTLPDGEYRHQCRLPPGNLGLQQDLTYCLAAGDCRTPRYRIQSQVAPAIVVDKVLYHYPEYTGIADRTALRQGDLQAVEGTEVTIDASANTEIKPGTAEIDRGCTGLQGIRMTTDGRTAIGHFTLRVNPKDASAAEFDSYQIRFADAQGRENTGLIRYRVEVLPDRPPVVEWIEPRQEEVQVALDETLPIKFRAEDPDFGLRQVALRAQCNNKSLPIAPQLDQQKPKRARSGEFLGTYSFNPRQLKLKPGDQVEYWVEVEDSREPVPGKGVSTKQRLRIIGSDQPQPDNRTDEAANDKQSATGGRENDATKEKKADQAAGKNPSQEKNAENGLDNQPNGQQSSSEKNQSKQPDESAEKPSQDQSSESSKGNQGKGEAGSGKKGQENRQQQDGQSNEGQQEGQQGEKSNPKIDPDAAPGDAMQAILNDRQKQQDQKQAKENQSQSEKQSSEGEKSDQKNTGEEKTGGEKTGEKGEKGENANAGKQQGKPEQQGQEKAGTEKGGSEKSSEKGVNENAEKRQGKGEPQGHEKSGEKGENENAETQQGRTEEQEKGKLSEKGSDKPIDNSQRDSKPGEGKNAGNDKGRPAPQNQNLDREKKPGQTSDESSQKSGDMAQSPSSSKQQSEASSQTAGDRSGGGEQGGGQRANQSGAGSPGSHTPADEGDSQAGEPGKGEVGAKAGDQSVAKQPTGSSEKSVKGENGSKGEEDLKGDKGEKGGKDLKGEKGEKGEKGSKGEKGEKSDESGKGVESEKGMAGGKEGTNNGIPGGGGKPDTSSNKSTSPETPESSADEANLEYTKQQTALALDYLRDQLAKKNPELLGRLGWSEDDARRFLNRWEAMQRAAGEQGLAGENAKKQFNDALRSLGLRPNGVELSHGGIAPDQPQNLRDAGRFAPPADWAEQFREYTRGVAKGKQPENEKAGEGRGSAK